MSFLAKLLKRAFRRAPLAPLQFPSSGFDVISDAVKLEEEQLDGFNAAKYYPVRIGDVYSSKYQVWASWDMGQRLLFGWPATSSMDVSARSREFPCV